MSVKIGSVEFDGNRNTLQPPKPMLDYYTRLGDNRVYIQKVNVSSPVSTVSFWLLKENFSEIESTIKALVDIVGTRVSVSLASGYEHESCYLIDFTYNIRKSGCGYLLELEAQLIADERNDSVNSMIPSQVIKNVTP